MARTVSHQPPRRALLHLAVLRPLAEVLVVKSLVVLGGRRASFVGGSTALVSSAPAARPRTQRDSATASRRTVSVSTSRLTLLNLRRSSHVMRRTVVMVKVADHTAAGHTLAARACTYRLRPRPGPVQWSVVVRACGQRANFPGKFKTTSTALSRHERIRSCRRVCGANDCGADGKLTRLP